MLDSNIKVLEDDDISKYIGGEEDDAEDNLFDWNCEIVIFVRNIQFLSQNMSF